MKEKGQVREPGARQFGQRMVDDRSKANNQLKELASAGNIPLPNAPDAENQALRERLDKAQGNAFDRDVIFEARSPLIRRQSAVRI